MIRSQKRMLFCVTLLVLNVAFIWGNSLLPREISSAFSQFVGRILSLFVSGPITPAQGEGQGILRKIAHFTEFCSLGIILSWLFWMVRQKKWQCLLIPLMIGAAVAAIDETIQIFVPGRGPHIRDVGIDSLGVLLGVLIVALLAMIQKRRPEE